MSNMVLVAGREHKIGERIYRPGERLPEKEVVTWAHYERLLARGFIRWEPDDVRSCRRDFGARRRGGK